VLTDIFVLVVYNGSRIMSVNEAGLVIDGFCQCAAYRILQPNQTSLFNSKKMSSG
jgi:hypothetical protein